MNKLPIERRRLILNMLFAGSSMRSISRIADVSTSYVERKNLTMRISRRRFTRLTNAISKKLENHIHALALYFVHYNFCRIDTTLKTSPAMAAGLTDTLWALDDVIAKIDEMASPPAKRGPYNKRGDVTP